MALVNSSFRARHDLDTEFCRIVPINSADPSVDVDDPMDWTGDVAIERKPVLKPPSVDAIAQPDAILSEVPAEERSRLIIAVDFGTATSTVSYVKIEPGVDANGITVDKIACIDDYRHTIGYDARGNARNDIVPTKLLYLGAPKPRDPDEAPENSDSDTDDECLQALHVKTGRTPVENGKKDRRRSNKRSVVDEPSEPETPWSRPEGMSVKWGFAVQDKQSSPDAMMEYGEKETVELIKLTLGDELPVGDELGGERYEDDCLRNKCKEINEQIERLRCKGIVQDRNHILRDYLARLLLHAKQTLEKEGHLNATKVEYVLCVPVSWTERACRTMHDAMVKAIQACQLSTLPQDLIPDLFIVSEPEAAAQFVVACQDRRTKVVQDDVIVLLDAGGGTVDVTTYRITSGDVGPLRLQSEVVKSDGALCGSSLITERYLSKIEAKLIEIEPDGDRDLLRATAIALANEWDATVKRRINLIGDKELGLKSSLRYHKRKRIRWTADEIREIFEPSLRDTLGLLEKQLRLARECNLAVNKVILVGGFGESPSLQGRIEQFLLTSPNVKGETIDLIKTNWFPGSAIARGAALRALDKRNGPSRISRSSFGVLRHERFLDFPEHEGVAPERNPVDKEMEVRDTIFWVIQVGEELRSSIQMDPILSAHSFKPEDRELMCREELYVSMYRQDSHFQRDHPKNRAASLLGYIEIDMSDIINDTKLEAKVNAGPRTRNKNKFYREVTLDLVIEVEGKQLKYEARWPAGVERHEDVKKRVTGYVSLASSFEPGVV